MTYHKPPIATGFKVTFCGACPNAHLLYHDEIGRFICQATMSAEQARRIEREIKERDPNFREDR